MLSADREEPDLVTLAGKEEEVEKSEDRTESSGSSIEPGDLGSGAFDISKLFTINLRTLDTSSVSVIYLTFSGGSCIGFLFYFLMHFVSHYCLWIFSIYILSFSVSSYSETCANNDTNIFPIIHLTIKEITIFI